MKIFRGSIFRMIMEDTEYILPSSQDLLLSDVKEEDLRTGISGAFGVPFLEIAKENPSWPVEGILFGHNYRPFVCLHVTIRKKSIKVFFLVDTGSPHTYLSNTTMNALEIDIIPSSFRSMVHGVIIPAVNMSPLNSHYSDINILGADFLARRGFRVDLDYGLATIRIYPSD